MKYLPLIFLFLIACLRVGPDFETPDSPCQEQWLEANNPQFSEVHDPLTEWWEVFDDPTLDSLIIYAREQNLTLQIAAFRIMEARAQLGIAVGEFFPQLQEVQGGATRFKISENAPNSRFADTNYWEFLLGLRVAWELDFWGKFRRGIEAADEDLFASAADFDDVLVLLLADVAASYTTIRTLEKRIDIVKQNIAIQRRSLQIVEARWHAGAVTELDIQQARTLLFSTQSRLPPLEADVQATKNALATLLGVTPADLTCYFDQPGSIPIAPQKVGIGIPAQLLCRRPDVRRALHDAASQSARIGIAVSDLLPRISLSGFIGFQTSASTSTTRSRGGGSLFNKESLTYFFGPDIAWPILNYGRLTNRVHVERARFQQLLLNYQNTILIAYQEVEDGLITFLKAQEEVASRQESVKAAQRSTQLARTQYVEGLADYTRVLNTEEARLTEEEELTRAQGEIALSLIRTYRALGGGWQVASQS